MYKVQKRDTEIIESLQNEIMELYKDDRDVKIICVSTNDPRYLHTTDISGIEDHYRSKIAHFFQVHKDLEGRKVEILGWQSVKEAKKIIIESIKRYKNTLKKQNS